MHPILRTTVYARSVLSARAEGTVHSVYRKTINLRLGSHLLALQAADSPLSPISLITAFSAQEMASLPITAGQPVLVSDGAILFPSCGLCFSTDAAEAVSTKLCTAPKAALPALSAAIRFVLEQNGKDGFRCLFFPSGGDSFDELLVLSAAKNKIDSANERFAMSHYTMSAAALSSLIGLGIGLTPSGDDFLCGVLAGLRLMDRTDHPFACALRDAIRQQLSDTNAISRAFLHCALQGEYSEAVCSLIRSTDTAAIATSFLAIGHSSGMDTLSGIFYALTLPFPD